MGGYFLIFEESKEEHNSLSIFLAWNQFRYLQSFNAQNLMQIKKSFLGPITFEVPKRIPQKTFPKL
jgi:hypothetical protein